ncbi:MAG: hypothetical protein ACYDAZ_08430 [Thermoplasmataceae archaeon]
MIRRRKLVIVGIVAIISILVLSELSWANSNQLVVVTPYNSGYATNYTYSAYFQGQRTHVSSANITVNNSYGKFQFMVGYRDYYDVESGIGLFLIASQFTGLHATVAVSHLTLIRKTANNTYRYALSPTYRIQPIVFSGPTGHYIKSQIGIVIELGTTFNQSRNNLSFSFSLNLEYRAFGIALTRIFVQTVIVNIPPNGTYVETVTHNGN